MRAARQRFRRFVRRAERRGRVLVRSLLLHLLVLALVGLGLLARMSESSEVQLAAAEHAAALAHLDAPAPVSALPYPALGWSAPAPVADMSPSGAQSPRSPGIEVAPREALRIARERRQRAATGD